jgi:hypothetical protein
VPSGGGGDDDDDDDLHVNICQHLFFVS